MTVTTHVDVTGGTINGDIYGGGNEAISTASSIAIENVVIHDVYDKGREAEVININVDIKNVSG